MDRETETQSGEHLDLSIPLGQIESRDDYREIWKRISPVEATNTVENEKCKHRQGERFVFSNHYATPDGICFALHHVLQLYIFRASVGFPSWEPDDPRVYRIHCPAKKGTIWEVRRIEQEKAHG